jgi:hypothetical protein
MGTSLHILGNHSIEFGNRSFRDIAIEIKRKLDLFQFPNANFLRLAALHWADSNPKDVRTIREIKSKRAWTFYEEDEYFSFEKDRKIDFYGPFSLELTFEEHFIRILNPPYRYWHWFESADSEIVNEWRKYLYHVVRLFGGNRVVYLADNSHPLDKYGEHEDTFEKLEIALFEEFGSPKRSFKEVEENFYDSYYIDNFESIDWNKNIEFNPEMPEPDDTSSINYDLNNFSTKEELKKLIFSNEYIGHKVIEGQNHFFHAAVVEGLLCLHTGVVGESESLEVRLDKYAPFIFDDLVTEHNQKGFGRTKNFILNIKQAGNTIQLATLDMLETELLWSGLGRVFSLSSRNNEYEVHFSAADKNLVMKLLLEFRENNNCGDDVIFSLQDAVNE